MKKIIIGLLLTILLLFICTLASKAQFLKKLDLIPKKDIPSYIFIGLAGAVGGMNEALWAKNPYAGSQFSDPYISWTNKYENHDPAQGRKFLGSTGPFIWVTDLNHLTRFSSDIFYITAFALSWDDFKGDKRFLHVGKKILIGFLINRISHDIVFGGIYK